ncbi:FecR family protein [Novipirellula artificiosorum]|uniref:Fec operon regulator FecR n=1 Tax=Novipirellula artificiosorum TaxID=2528016 RepID=A0A5C6DMF7_9BACT|nr:FecR family protein [Novipirellula artificiosorum]TWU38533.1 fec operon regulator FecR [Novipirellula artificiosorum]
MHSNELIRRYVLGIASNEEVHELDRRLLNDEELQDEFLLQAELDAHLRQEAQLGSVDSGQLAPSTTHIATTTNSKVDSKRLQTTNRVLLTVAVVALIAVFGQVFLIRDSRNEIITVTSVSGPIAWTGDGGRVTNELAVGENFPGGTMELLAPDSFVEFAFEDQSTVSLAGLSAVTISTEQSDTPSKRQKELHLRHGRLSASVRKQPSGRPLLVHTPSAELTVLGTQFDVDAVSDSTRLTVNQGRVRLKRLPDGKEVEVPAQQSVLASLENQNGLSPRKRNSPVTDWQSDLREDVVKGKWISRLWGLGAKLKMAVANGEMTKDSAIKAYKNAAHFDDSTGSVWTVPFPFGALIVLSPLRSMEQPVLLNANTKVIVRGRSHAQVAVEIGLSVGHPDGGFAGKYSTLIPVSQLAGGEDFELGLPISKFRNETNSDSSLIGSELTGLWFVAEASAAKFEITGVELTDTPEKDKP